MYVVQNRGNLRQMRRELAVAYHDNHFERPLIGLTPTLGALHAGHRVLIERMVAECDVSIVSIFLNPRQFSSSEDLEQYPRTLDDDLKVCAAAGVQLVFAPGEEDVYPPGYATTVSIGGLTEHWCGAGRPGHFDGVTTVVAKLLTACQPDRAYFGEKDYQQLRVVQRMVRDLELNVEIVPCPTVREPDGLALSSRNQYLAPDERGVAPRICEALKRMAACFTGGVHDAASLIVEGEHVLHEGGGPKIEVEYLAVADPRTLEPREEARLGDRVLIAATIGDTRLIDNIALTGEEIEQ